MTDDKKSPPKDYHIHVTTNSGSEVIKNVWNNTVTTFTSRNPIETNNERAQHQLAEKDLKLTTPSGNKAHRKNEWQYNITCGKDEISILGQDPVTLDELVSKVRSELTQPINSPNALQRTDSLLQAKKIGSFLATGFEISARQPGNPNDPVAPLVKRIDTICESLQTPRPR